jgi:hypothetical protein
MKIRIPATIPARIPIEKMEPSGKGESEIAGKSVKDQKIIKIISAATIDTEADIKIRNKFFKCMLFLV